VTRGGCCREEVGSLGPRRSCSARCPRCGRPRSVRCDQQCSFRHLLSRAVITSPVSMRLITTLLECCRHMGRRRRRHQSCGGCTLNFDTYGLRCPAALLFSIILILQVKPLPLKKRGKTIWATIPFPAHIEQQTTGLASAE
jgi:hypothetical protein